ncbi:MAG: DUF6379 domain-containing protein [Chloroflexi bacterium]|nr:DUF6379 domain-containing protein [Chloroflexota bacterium]
MVTVPGFLLRRLYVKKSLKNTQSGFEFQLKNGLGSGYAHTMRPLSVDGEEIPTTHTYFTFEGKETPFSAVSKENTFTLAMNRAITIQVDGARLSPGPHKIGMGFDVPGLGTLRFDFTDVVADE